MALGPEGAPDKCFSHQLSPIVPTSTGHSPLRAPGDLCSGLAQLLLKLSHSQLPPLGKVSFSRGLSSSFTKQHRQGFS